MAATSLRAGPPRESLADNQARGRQWEQAAALAGPDDANLRGATSGRKLFIMRAAERMDKIFPEWMRDGFSGPKKAYMPYDLNMPTGIPNRRPEDYYNDPPITEIGFMTSQLVGRAFTVKKHNITEVYSSPALRCVQTACAALRVMDREKKIKVKIEPGLFEWLGFHEEEGLPHWMTSAQFKENGYSVDEDYNPVMPMEMMSKRRCEIDLDFSIRLTSVTEKILKDSPAREILVVSHATTMDLIARQRRNRKIEIMKKSDMERLPTSYPYCCVVGLEEMANGMWRSMKNPMPYISYMNHTSQVDFDTYNR